MTDDTKFVTRALQIWNSMQSPWTPVKTFGQLTAAEQSRVMGIAQDLKIQEKDFIGV
jgi:hypothetical protein